MYNVIYFFFLSERKKCGVWNSGASINYVSTFFRYFFTPPPPFSMSAPFLKLYVITFFPIFDPTPQKNTDILYGRPLGHKIKMLPLCLRSICLDNSDLRVQLKLSQWGQKNPGVFCGWWVNIWLLRATALLQLYWHIGQWNINTLCRLAVQLCVISASVLWNKAQHFGQRFWCSLSWCVNRWRCNLDRELNIFFFPSGSIRKKFGRNPKSDRDLINKEHEKKD